MEEIEDLWSSDCAIDETNLTQESLKIPTLHSKYMKIYTSEKLVLKVLEQEFHTLKKNKTEFLSTGDFKTEQTMGWKHPGRIILKGDIQLYMDADEDIQRLSLKVAMQSEKIHLLDSILRNINNRGFYIKNAIDYLRFTNGLN